MQVLVYGETGKGDLVKLIKEATVRKLIPSDRFSVDMFNIIGSTLMEQRQKTGDPHPKKEYANERTAIFVINLVMIFMQHSINDK